MPPPSSSPVGGPFAGVTVAFDLDGTLVDTAPDLIGALNTVMREEGLASVPVSSARMLVGKGARALIERGFALAGRSLDEETGAVLTHRFLQVYRERIAEESRPFAGVEAALSVLSDGGARLCVCTNKRTDLAVSLLDVLDLSSRFVSVTGGDLPPRPKPDGSHVRAAIAMAGGDPGRAVMVGDSINDLLAARAAGVPAVLVSFGYTEEPASTLGADVVVDDFGALPAAITAVLADASPCPPPRPPL